MRIGSLCSGYGGLTLAVQDALGGEVAWHSEVDEAPSKVLDLRFPGVPNLGDMTEIDWATVEPVDVLEGGTPCQDVSHAGPRGGMRAGNRSGLWSAMADAIDVLRPRLVVWENVRGVLSAGADSGVEPCPVCMGDGQRPALRALGRVLGDLADLGYDARWVGVRASDVGAPHPRFRVFVVAQDPDTGRRDRSSATDTDRDAVREQPEPVTGGSGQAIAVQPRAEVAANPDSWQRDRGEQDPQRQQEQRKTTARSGTGLPAYNAPADSDRDGLGQLGGIDPVERDADRRGSADTAWGPYEPAVRRWERLTRPAPAPTEPGRTSPVLAPRFVEWMMGLPGGWVTDVPGLSRNDQLKMLGNGVVPQQAAAAVRHLLDLP